jgi:hypothetical protein
MGTKIRSGATCCAAMQSSPEMFVRNVLRRDAIIPKNIDPQRGAPMM